MFEVVADRDLRLLSVSMHGFWDDATMTAYRQTLRATMDRLQRDVGCARILIDMTGYPIQPKQIAEGHGALLRGTAQLPGLRVALVMQSALSKIQATRLAANIDHRKFDTREAALEWLLAD